MSESDRVQGHRSIAIQDETVTSGQAFQLHAQVDGVNSQRMYIINISLYCITKVI